MMQHTRNIKPKKSDIIIINNDKLINSPSVNSPSVNSPSVNSPSVNSPKMEYGLNRTFFDPLNGSPPNDFMIKLQKRMSSYYVDNNLYKLDIK
jgi:hypothetical protein